jgi:hypothetical protein
MNQEVKTKTDTLVCYNHPDRETMLRCNRCDRPICTACAVLTPTGYRCKECVRGQLKVFDTAQTIDFPLAFITAGVISFFGSIAASYLGFFTIFIAPVIGVVLAEAVRWVVRKRRSKLLFQVATAGVILGALPLILLRLAGMAFGGGSVVGLISLLWPGVYVFLVTSTAYYRLSGIQLR